MRNLLHWLAGQLDWLAHRREGVEALDEIQFAVTTIRNTIDTGASLAYIGPCDVCKRDLYALDGRPTLECPDCGMTYEVSERRAWLLSLWRDRLGTAVEISRALNAWASLDVTPERIRVLAQRDRVVRHTAVVGGRERSVYRFGDVEEQAIADAERKGAQQAKNEERRLQRLVEAKAKEAQDKAKEAKRRAEKAASEPDPEPVICSAATHLVSPESVGEQDDLDGGKVDIAGL